MQGHKAPDGLRASTDMAEVVKHAELLLMVIPTPFVAATITGIKDLLRPEQACLLQCGMPCRHFAQSQMQLQHCATIAMDAKRMSSVSTICICSELC